MSDIVERLDRRILTERDVGTANDLAKAAAEITRLRELLRISHAMASSRIPMILGGYRDEMSDEAVKAFQELARELLSPCRKCGGTGTVQENTGEPQPCSLCISPAMKDADIEGAKWRIWQRALELELPLIQADAEELAKVAMHSAKKG